MIFIILLPITIAFFGLVAALLSNDNYDYDGYYDEAF